MYTTVWLAESKPDVCNVLLFICTTLSWLDFDVRRRCRKNKRQPYLLRRLGLSVQLVPPQHKSSTFVYNLKIFFRHEIFLLITRLPAHNHECLLEINSAFLSLFTSGVMLHLRLVWNCCHNLLVFINFHDRPLTLPNRHQRLSMLWNSHERYSTLRNWLPWVSVDVSEWL